MKVTRYALLYSLVFSLLCLFSYCGGDDPKAEPTQQEIVTEKLVAGGSSWKPPVSTPIKADGIDVSELFENFSLKFNANGTYTSTGTTPIWARNGSWTFTSADATAFTKEDGNVVTIVTLENNRLVLTLYWDKETYEGGRSNSIVGNYTFELSPN